MSQYIDLWLFVLSIASICLGWFLRTLYEKQQEMGRDLADLEVKLAEEYVPNERLKDMTEALFARFDNFDRKLDQLFTPIDRRRTTGD